VAGAIVLAPHILVEAISVQSIEQARQAYMTTDLRSKLARHHADPDSAFWGWNTIWLDAAFRDWSLENEITSITCPLLAVQGMDDDYGTLEQIRGIQRRVPHTELLELADCGHSPHRDQPARLIERAQAFYTSHAPSQRK
jgi:pimeloyl-ACP methyl ester carboxylesterase